MANGTMIGMSDYIAREGIITSETFSGDPGDNTNPYAIEDVYDLIAAVEADTYYRLVNDVDFNDHETYRFGVSTAICCKAPLYSVGGICGRKLNSDYRYRIRNIIFSGGGHFAYMGTFDSVIFSNIIVNPTTTSSIFTNCKLKKCSVGIFANKVSGGTVMPITSQTSTKEHTDTSFNIKGTITSALYTYGKTFTRCHINLDNLNVGGALFDSGTFNSSWITGSVTPMQSNLNMYCTSTTLWTDTYAAVQVNCDSSVTVNTIPSEDILTFNGTCFIDKGLLPDTAVLKEATNLHYLTTEQATDPDYLNSIGFVVAGVT